MYSIGYDGFNGFSFSPEKGEGDQHGPETSKKPRFHRQMENGVLYFGARESHAPH